MYRANKDRGELAQNTINRVRGWLRALFPWLLMGTAGWLLATQVQQCSSLPSGEPAPNLAVQLEGGGEIDLASLSGKVVVLNFYATWCPPCRQEAPELSRVHAALESEGGMVLGISMDEMDLPSVVALSRRLGMTYPIGMTTRETIAQYKVSSLPTTYVVDGNGMIVASFVGGVTESMLQDAIEDADRGPQNIAHAE